MVVFVGCQGRAALWLSQPQLPNITVPFFSPTAEQWKPLNPEEKKRYDREFLLGFQFIFASMQKPEGLPQITDVVLDKVGAVLEIGVWGLGTSALHHLLCSGSCCSTRDVSKAEGEAWEALWGHFSSSLSRR